ncbi:MAG: serine O-acetyltransferase [Candidatus Tectomicrobia bacterium]|nr:serine O-acetyltransferase [Candidatus Tectomicrobia bacterium]
MVRSLRRDIQAALERDPAARNWLEVVFCYPGFHALLFYRVSHWFWQQRLCLLARWFSHLGRFFTGIEIHPAAKLGAGLFIDHGMGVVIGETAEVGENCTLYHGVTLGGTRLAKEKRHPTVGDNVVIGVGAKVLGNLKIGDNSRIGANSVVIRDVPPNSTAVGIPSKVVEREVSDQSPAIDLNHADLPDLQAAKIAHLMQRVEELELEMARLQQAQNASWRAS